MKHEKTFPLILLATALANPPVWAFDDGPQMETPFDCAGSTEPYAIAYGVHTVNAAIDLPTDIDVFEFQGQAGDVIRIRFKALTNNLDPQLCVYGPNNQLIVCDACVSGLFDACAFEINEIDLPALPLTGTYRIVVQEQGVDNAGAYMFQLERVSPRLSDRRLAYNAPTQDDLAQVTDLDGFSFCGVAGSLLRLSFRSLTNNLDPRVEVRQPDGTVLDTPGCDSGLFDACSFSFDFSPTSSGEYRLFIWDSGIDNVGGYELSVNCILGCPPLASSLQRNGSGVNPVVYDSKCPAVLGGAWKGEIDTTAYPTATDVLVFSFTRLLNPPVPFRNLGELLVDVASPRVGLPICLPIDADGIARCSFKLPCTPALAGFRIASQAVINVPRQGHPQLTNALELVLGY